MNFLKSRLKEASTWRAIVAIATALGLKVNPDQAAAIVSTGLAVMGIIGAFFPDKVGEPTTLKDTPKMDGVQ